VLLVAHQAVVLCFRYLLEQMNEEQILTISQKQEVANCSVTTYAYDANVGKRGGMALRSFNFVAPLLEAGAEITRKPDVPVAPK
jgi:broad specificity phosphatase PhoE